MSLTIADLLPGRWEDLISPLEDEKIREVEEQYLQKEKDDRIIVKLEGKRDVRLFKKFGDKEKHRYQRIGRRKGKSQVINHVIKFTDDLGIVDMDHDFRGAEIGLYSIPPSAFSNRIADSRGSCCLFDLAIGGEILNAATMVIRRLYDDNRRSREIVWKLREKGNDFTSLVRELTAARLFKGHSSNSEPSTEPKFTWSEIGNLEHCTSHIISEASADDFSNFKGEYTTELDKAGFNDHAFSDALKSLLREGFDEDEMPADGALGHEITQAMLRLGKRVNIEPILTKLGNYESP